MANQILVRCAIVTHQGQQFHVSNMFGETKCLETGRSKNQGRRDFCKWVKSLGGVILPDLKTGQYINMHTGEIENLWGI